ncbi:MAG TPA: hypothetical protein VFQ45_09720 [Longimicrobium sp.]|nr:hypothetical protein [Longimicrobium sp.]
MNAPTTQSPQTPTRDPLVDRELRPDRLHYATGAMLDSGDFLAEQLYHRGRLARALLLLHGPGTVAGLRVRVETVTPEKKDPQAGTFAPPEQPYERVRVLPGAAIDRLGRLVEVPASACLRLERWMENLSAADRSNALYWSADAGSPHHAAGPPVDAERWGRWRGQYLLADLYLRFHACERGKTPAFATGPYDALDAVQPSRVRDGYELKLYAQPFPELPPDPWAAVEADPRAVQERVLDGGYPTDASMWEGGGRHDPARPAHYPSAADPTAVLLARLFIPVLESGARDTAVTVRVDNHARPWAYPAPALARLASTAPAAAPPALKAPRRLREVPAPGAPQPEKPSEPTQES